MFAPRLAVVLAALTAATACSKKDSEADSRKTPWLATPSAAAPTLAARYTVVERCRAEVELRAKEASPRGTFRVCRGELDLDLLDLSKTRGTLSVDVASIEMLEGSDAGRSDDLTQQAQNWLDVGASRPEAERERLRWAAFSLTGIDDPSATAAHQGKREVSKLEAPMEGEDASAPGERRVVTFTARGFLVLHGVRVEVSLPMRAAFHYSERATAEQVPERIELETRRPLAVSLGTHDIKPRDAAGVFQAQEMKLLGRQVGRDARVSLSAELRSAPR